MSFMAKSANYQRHFRESAAWRLLRADNAPFILAFILRCRKTTASLRLALRPKQCFVLVQAVDIRQLRNHAYAQMVFSEGYFAVQCTGG
jgi:hypothetical protein